MKIFIIKGTPGSGRTTLANELLALYKGIGKTVEIIEANDFMINPETKQYEFVQENVSKSFSQCYVRFNELLEKKTEVIIVTNINGHFSEYASYITRGRNNGYTVHVMSMENHHEGKSTIGIPDKFVVKMCRKYQHYPHGYPFYREERARRERAELDNTQTVEAKTSKPDDVKEPKKSKQPKKFERKGEFQPKKKRPDGPKSFVPPAPTVLSQSN